MSKKKLFDFCIGNPPYQDNTIGDNKTYAPPVYNFFMDEANKIANSVELVHPARFLFNAGSTPKSWNKKILSDSHFKILHYEEDSNKIFNNTNIKGGIAISYHDECSDYGAIEIFTPYTELNSILHKIKGSSSFIELSSIIVTSYAYHFTEALYIDHPDLKNNLSKGHAYDFKSNVFEKMPTVFYEKEPHNPQKYVRILGRVSNERVYRYILSKYVNEVVNLYSYKVFLPGAIGTGAFGEAISTPIIGNPSDGTTETFLSIGTFDTQKEAEAAIKYIKTKFARSLFGILKKTQANTPEKWKYVPLQDFTSSSDIDWSKSIHEIDLQLYRKYGLSDAEIDFIEANVKEMK